MTGEQLLRDADEQIAVLRRERDHLGYLLLQTEQRLADALAIPMAPPVAEPKKRAGDGNKRKKSFARRAARKLRSTIRTR